MAVSRHSACGDFTPELSARVPTTDNEPTNNTTPTKPTLSDTCSLDTVYFVNDVLPIFIANCAYSGCHDEASQQDGVILTDYDNIINTADVRAGDPDGSDLYEAITETDPQK